jgi:tetratricopeptide (TPR) repeat protein
LKKRTADLTSELERSSRRYSDAVNRRSNRLTADAEYTGKLLDEKRNAEKDLIKAQQDLRAKSSEAEELRKELNSLQALVKSSRAAVIELKSKQHSSEIELKKLSQVQKAYDELKARFDLIQRSSGDDVLKTLNRIPGLEESLRRYEKENKNLLSEIAALKKKVPRSSGKTLGDFRNVELEKVETLLADARSAEARGNLEVAVWGYRQVLLRDGKNQAALVSLGNIALNRGKFSEAAELLEQAVAASPADAKLVNACVRSLIGLREYDKALSKIAEFKKANPKAVKAEMLLTEAVAWSRSGKNSDAEKSFKAVLKLQPANAEAAYELALMLSADEKRRQEAGEYYVLAKNNGGAVDSYLEELLRSFSGPDLATRDFLLGNVSESLNKQDMAQSAWYLAEVKKLYPADKEYLYFQSLHNIHSGSSAEAVKALSNAADDRSRWLHALALRQSKQYDQALAVLAKTGKLSNSGLIEAVKKFAAANPDKDNKKAQQVTAALLEKLP